MKLVLDAGALIGIDRDERRVAGLIELGRRAGTTLVTTAPVLAQVWRDGARQARLARALPMIDVREAGMPQARAAGELLAVAGTSDVVDALLVLVAGPSDQVLTSDPSDIRGLLDHREMSAIVVRV